jgi:peptidoglycan/xylan/chitin deacetylase (PgdA/CDA1 family)
VSTDQKSAKGPKSAAGPRVTWRGLAVRGLYRSGGIGLARRVARSLVLQRVSDSKWPKLRKARDPRFAVLCYHRVGTGGIPLYSELPARAFEQQMRYLRKNYRILSLDELIREMGDPCNSEPAVAVTFDDGYRGLFTEAFPVLQAYEIPATVFLTIECIETGEVAWYDRVFLALKAMPGNTLELELDRPARFSFDDLSTRMQAAAEIISRLRGFPPTLRRRCCADLESKVVLPEAELRDRMLTWDQVRVMHRGGVDFGSHTMTHPVVSRLSPAEMQLELLQSKQILEERLDRPVRHFAFPFGKRDECGEAATSMLANAGYQSAGTTEWGLNSAGSNPFQLYRVQIGELGSQAMFAFQLARLFLESSDNREGARHSNPTKLPVSRQMETEQVGR